ncbi:MAG TPA: acetylxylan esterase [archaeon]|nr:acetylxylan esterase [archaeon]
MKNSRLIILLICLPCFHLPVFGQEHRSAAEFTVLDQPADRMMDHYLTSIIDSQFALRDSLLGTLKTTADWDRRAQVIRDSILSWTGPLPEKTPLNARITGRLEREDYLIEKIVFESRPSFPVSASLYLPKGHPGRRAAVLNVIGHSAEGKATGHVQRRSISQAKKGFVALTIDGIGQGERRIADYASYGSLPGSVHRVVGMQAFLSGTHLFNFMVWDAIRAVDYLCTRPEVDSERIGITGTSGGGMMTTYILPFEPRIEVAVPACNPNTWSYRVHAGLATDHEQVFFSSFTAGIDPRGDPLFTHVPKPLLINATTDDDLNPPGGVWALSTWLYRAYAAHGAPDRFQTSMVKAPHDYNREQREVTYAWMLKWLGGDPADFPEGDFPVEKEEDLRCAPSGNVYLEEGSLEPHDLVKSFLDQHRPGWGAVKSAEDLRTHRERLCQSIKYLLRIEDPTTAPTAEIKAPRWFAGGKLTPVILGPEKGIVLPGVWLEPQNSSERGPVVLFLHDEGKIALAGKESLARALLDKKFRILAVDLRGTGETAPGLEDRFWDFLAGKPIAGGRVTDICACLEWLKSKKANPDSIYIWASGVSGLWAVLASAISQGVSGLILEDLLCSFESAVSVRLPAYNQEIIVPGVLRHFDLPQVFQALAPRKVSLVNPLMGDKSPALKSELDRTYSRVKETYQALGAGGAWSVATGVSGQRKAGVILSFFKD